MPIGGLQKRERRQCRDGRRHDTAEAVLGKSPVPRRTVARQSDRPWHCTVGGDAQVNQPGERCEACRERPVESVRVQPPARVQPCTSSKRPVCRYPSGCLCARTHANAQAELYMCAHAVAHASMQSVSHAPRQIRSNDARLTFCTFERINRQAREPIISNARAEPLSRRGINVGLGPMGRAGSAAYRYVSAVSAEIVDGTPPLKRFESMTLRHHALSHAKSNRPLPRH